VQNGITDDWVTIKNGANSTLISRSLDPAGRIVLANAGSFSADITYDGYGRRESQAYFNGITGTWNYDVLNRVTNIGWTGPLPVKEALTYSAAGNITQVARENGTSSISYDADNQLLSSTGIYAKTFGYDLLGNRTQDSTNGPGTVVSNFLLANTQSSFQSDPDGFGQVTSQTGLTNGGRVQAYTYRADGLLSSFVAGSLTVQYSYDALGRRIAKSISDSYAGTSFKQAFTYLGSGDQILLGKAGNGTLTTYIDGKNPGEHLGEVAGTAASGYVTDHLGSVLSGNASWGAQNFGLFGELSAPPSQNVSSQPVNYGYAGYETDPESSNYHTHYREYSPSVGRWLSQDSIGTRAGDSNFYRYVGNNSLGYTDPTGLSAQDVGTIATIAQQTLASLNNQAPPGAEYGTGFFNAALNNISRSTYDLGIAGRNYLACDELADAAVSSLSSVTSFDDQWTFENDLYGGFHHVAIGYSSNPSDPIVIVDLWRGTVSNLPRTNQ
jgi:RHS repeat-associated protein